MALLTYQEAAARARVTDRTIREWVALGKLAYVEMPNGRGGSKRHIDMAALDALLHGGGIPDGSGFFRPEPEGSGGLQSAPDASSGAQQDAAPSEPIEGETVAGGDVGRAQMAQDVALMVSGQAAALAEQATTIRSLTEQVAALAGEREQWRVRAELAEQKVADSGERRSWWARLWSGDDGR